MNARSIFRLWPLAACLSVSQLAFAITEGPDFATEYKKVIEPFFASGRGGTIIGKKGIRLTYRTWEVQNEKGAIVFIPGRGDSFHGFQETFYELTQAGYSVYALDERGQGYSQRILPEQQRNPSDTRGYVDSFEYYAKDLKKFVTQIVNAKPHSKKFLMGHSMGGGISALYLLRYRNDFDGAVLVAPMLKINTAPYEFHVAQAYADFLIAKGDAKEYTPNHGPFDPNSAFDKNAATSSRLRWQIDHDIYVSRPELQIGDATVKWVHEAFQANRAVHWQARKIRTPILILTALEDTIVDVAEQGFYCSHVKNCTQYSYPAKHHLLGEVDSIRDEVLKRIFQFIGR